MTARAADRPSFWQLSWPSLLAWVALVALLGASWYGAYVPLGTGNLVLGLAIAALKAALVGVIFMRLGTSSVLLRLAAAGGVVWLAFMFSLTFSDLLTRVR